MKRNALCVAAIVVIATASISFGQEKKTEEKAAPAAAVADRTAICPVTGKPADRKVMAKFRGKRVYFADADAKKKFEDSSDKYLDGVKKQWEALKPLRTQVKCPVSGKPVDHKFAVSGADEDVYFATEDAKKVWEKDSKPYAEKLEKECYSFQTNCLVCGMEIDPAISVEVDGRTIFVGCNGCPDRIKADKDKYIKQYDEVVKANKAAFEKERTASK